MLASTASFILALAGAASAVSTAELVAQLRGAPTQVDRIRALNDTQVCSHCTSSFLRLLTPFHSIPSTSLTLPLVSPLVKAAIPWLLHPRTSLPLLEMVSP